MCLPGLIINLWIKLRLICGRVRRALGRLSNKGHPLLLVSFVPSVVEALGVAEQHLEPLEPLSNYPRIGRVNGIARPFKGRESTARIQLRNIVAAVRRRSIRDSRWQRTSYGMKLKEKQGERGWEKEKEGRSENLRWTASAWHPSYLDAVYGTSQMRITRISRCPDSICLRGCRRTVFTVRAGFPRKIARSSIHKPA